MSGKRARAKRASPSKAASKRLRSARELAYTPGALLGKGHYCRVYECVGAPDVCIKQLRDNYDPNTLVHERYIMGRVRGHINVLAVVDHAPDHAWLALERADACLDAYIRTGLSDLTYRRTAQIKGLWVQLLRALAHCHKHNIVHRDVKPENALVITRGTAVPILKLSDFGMAAELGGTSKQRKAVRGQDYVTQWYRAPELLMGMPQYGAAVDVWSAGCVLAEMLFGGNALFVCYALEDNVKQLNVVWSLRGTPDVSDTRPRVRAAARAFGRTVPAAHFGTTLAPPVNRNKHAVLFVPTAIRALEHALELQETRRETAEELLREPWLRTHRPQPLLPE